MAKASLDDIRALPDVLMSIDYDVIIANVPGGGDGRSLSLKAQQVNWPDLQIDAVVIPLHGVEITQGGREVFSHTFDVTFVETRDLSVRKAIRTWMELVRQAKSGKGGYKSDYATTVQLIAYDAAGNIVRNMTVTGVYPQTMSGFAMDGSSSTALTVQVTFEFDEHSEV
jgi:hypothetical protein